MPSFCDSLHGRYTRKIQWYYSNLSAVDTHVAGYIRLRRSNDDHYRIDSIRYYMHM